MSSDIYLIALEPLPEGFPGAATDGNAPFWARVSFQVHTLAEASDGWPEFLELAAEQGGAAGVIRLEAFQNTTEFMNEYAEILLMATGGTLIINGFPGDEIAEPSPAYTTAAAIRAGLLATDLWLFTDMSYAPTAALLAEGRVGRFTVLQRRDRSDDAPPPSSIFGVEISIVPLDDDWARQNIVQLSELLGGAFGPVEERAATFRAEIAQFLPDVLEVQAVNRASRLRALGLARELAQLSDGVLIDDQGHAEDQCEDERLRGPRSITGR